ncbi:hypothetical protein [Roseomonas marmotae]|uniref:Uncharacterized protein n=1 Tax=Roseomonas marmotae TaxID=2768161 RepID=A0ABS3K8K2_9PROT|nr:hypothetical protein [Roseomonas marmotae]MBO1073793.1 hypothetical protein [Roseomonas marmotae]QTI78577.1 hypothetical protein IAI58_12955 [Roseomonas marmotae]
MSGSSTDLSVEILDDAVEHIVEVFREGDKTTKLLSLCMMAHAVSHYPEGEIQDWAEDRLSSLMAELELSADDLELIRYFRAA